jgi:hypothetical protein
MKIFLFKALSFFILICFSWIALYITYLDRNLAPVNFDYDMFIIGDSRSHTLKNNLEEYGYFNFSSRGDSYQDMYRKIDFLTKKVAVKTILLQVDEYHVLKYRESLNNDFISVNYTTYRDYKNFILYFYIKYIKPSILDSQIKDVVKKYLHNLLNKLNVHTIMFLNENVTINEGNINLNQDLNDRFHKQYGKGKSLFLENYLEKILKICKDKDIELIGIKYPIRSDYLDIISNTSLIENSFLLTDEYKTLDYSSAFRSKSDYFQDQDHLNDLGAFYLINLLKNDLED